MYPDSWSLLKCSTSFVPCPQPPIPCHLSPTPCTSSVPCTGYPVQYPPSFSLPMSPCSCPLTTEPSLRTNTTVRHIDRYVTVRKCGVFRKDQCSKYVTAGHTCLSARQCDQDLCNGDRRTAWSWVLLVVLVLVLTRLTWSNGTPYVTFLLKY